MEIELKVQLVNILIFKINTT